MEPEGNIARDVGVKSPTVKTYFQILEETYMGIVLPHYHQSVRKSQIGSPKFYFFDTGLKKALEGSLDSVPTPGTSQFGELFETFLILEIYRLNQYFEKDFRLSFFRTKHGNEIDLILTKGRKRILVEIKSSSKVDELEVRNFSRLSKDFGPEPLSYYLSQDLWEREIENVKCLHWSTFLKTFHNF